MSTIVEPVVKQSWIVCLARRAISKFGSFSGEMSRPYVMEILIAPVILY